MNNIVKALSPRIPADIPKIREAIKTIPFMARFSLSDPELNLLWEAFSSDQCAGYLNVHDQTLSDFVEWCQQ